MFTLDSINDFYNSLLDSIMPFYKSYTSSELIDNLVKHEEKCSQGIVISYLIVERFARLKSLKKRTYTLAYGEKLDQYLYGVEKLDNAVQEVVPIWFLILGIQHNGLGRQKYYCPFL